LCLISHLCTKKSGAVKRMLRKWLSLKFRCKLLWIYSESLVIELYQIPCVVLINSGWNRVSRTNQASACSAWAMAAFHHARGLHSWDFVILELLRWAYLVQQEVLRACQSLKWATKQQVIALHKLALALWFQLFVIVSPFLPLVPILHSSYVWARQVYPEELGILQACALESDLHFQTAFWECST